jgi:hypothetical protein
MTTPETISEKLQNIKDTRLEEILKVSGSAAITKNEYGVTIVNENDSASSLIFKSLTKDKYDNTELQKAIDVVVKELKPNIPKPNLDLVPRPLYDEKVVENEDLRKQVEDLTATVSDLNTQITTLKSEVETQINNRLNIEQTNDALVNQLEILSKTISEFAMQISNAVQKSIDESILRASLQAQNKGFFAQITALIKQIDSLNSIIEGLQAQLGASQQQQAIVQGTRATALASGADMVLDVALIKLEPSTAKSEPPIKANISSELIGKWINGQTIKFTNNDKEPIKVEISVTYPQGVRFFNVPETSFSVPAGGSKDITLTLDTRATEGKSSHWRRNGWGFLTERDSSDYTGGSMNITVTNSQGKSEVKTYGIKLSKKTKEDYANHQT